MKFRTRRRFEEMTVPRLEGVRWIGDWLHGLWSLPHACLVKICAGGSEERMACLLGSVSFMPGH